jgi:UDP-3-O-[3-hydroxymyristoyl] glucosamine N-acyltransferase
MMRYQLSTIATAVGGQLSGDPALAIERIRPVDQAGDGDLAVVIDRRWEASLDQLHAAALIVSHGLSLKRQNVIRVSDPRRALAAVLRMFDPAPRPAPWIAPGVFIAPDVIVPSDIYLESGVHIAAGVTLGSTLRIHANSVIGEGSIIGDDTVIYPNVTIYPGSRIGARVRIHAGTVIGSDGFGYERDPRGQQTKVPQLGWVEIGDDVEIGANCAIDRATLDATRIGRGTKIDNLVQIGHNSQIGEDCCIVSQVGISGSVRLGAGVTLAGQVGVADHVALGDGVVVGAQAGVHSDLPSGIWLGTPAIPVERARRVFPVIAHLPEYRERVRELERRLAELESRLCLSETTEPHDP